MKNIHAMMLFIDSGNDNSMIHTTTTKIIYSKYTHPLQGTCELANPTCIVLLAPPKINKLNPIKTYTNRIYNGPMETRVKNILPTNFTPYFSTLWIGIERSNMQNSGMGKNIHIMCPHVIIVFIFICFVFYRVLEL